MTRQPGDPGTPVMLRNGKQKTRKDGSPVFLTAPEKSMSAVLNYLKEVPGQHLTTLELSENLHLVPRYTRRLLARLEDRGLIRRDRVNHDYYWSVNVREADQPAAAPQKQGAVLTARHSPPGVGSSRAPLHHRQR